MALSADGNTALIGGWRDNGGVGAAWAFVDPPAPTSGAATSVGETGATLNGALAAGGSSKAYFQYGTTAAYGASASTQSVGVSTDTSSLTAAIGGLAPGTSYHFRLVAENSGGVAYGSDQTLTTAPKEVTPPPPPPPPPTPPAVEQVRQSTTRWREGSRLASISRAKTPTGTTFSFSLNEVATVTFSFTKRASGHQVTAGRLTFTGHSGTNKVVFQGRVSPVKKLKPGRYTLVITATSSAGMRSAPRSLSFTIVK